MQDDIRPSQPLKDDSLNNQEPEPQNVNSSQVDMTTPMPEASIEPATSTIGPISSTPDASSAGPSPAPKSKKKLIIGGVVAAVLVILGGGGAAAYNLWYQNPDKVLGDALVNTIKAKSVAYTGSFDMQPKAGGSSPVTKFKLSVDGKNSTAEAEFNAKLEMTYQSKDVAISGSAIYDKDMNLYIKIKDIRKTLTALGVPLEQMPAEYDAIITKIDNKWVKITPDDLGDLDKDYEKKQKCIKETSERLNGDKEAISELTELYKKNMFIQVDEKLGSKDGSLGYLIKGDKDKLKNFVKGFDDTMAAKEYQKCDDSFKIDPSMFDASNSSSTDKNMKTRFEVWISRWSHKLTSVKLTIEDDEAKGEIVVNTQFDVDVSVQTPTSDIVTLADLKKDIEAAFQSQAQQYNDIESRAQAAQTNSSVGTPEMAVSQRPSTGIFENLGSN